MDKDRAIFVLHPQEPGASKRVIVAYLEPEGGELVCGFEDGSVARLALGAIGLPGGRPIIFAYPDEFLAGIVLVREDGTEEDVATDMVLYKTDAAYRSHHERAEKEPLGAVVGRNLAKFRKAHRLSLREMAARVAMAASNYTRLEKGRHDPSTTTLNRLAQALGVPLAQLVRSARSPSPRSIY